MRRVRSGSSTFWVWFCLKRELYREGGKGKGIRPKVWLILIVGSKWLGHCKKKEIFLFTSLSNLAVFPSDEVDVWTMVKVGIFSVGYPPPPSRKRGTCSISRFGHIYCDLPTSHKGEKVFPLRLSVISVRKRESELGFLFRVGVNSSFLGKTRFICPIWHFSTIFSGPRAKFPVFFTFNIPVCEWREMISLTEKVFFSWKNFRSVFECTRMLTGQARYFVWSCWLQI